MAKSITPVIVRTRQKGLASNDIESYLEGFSRIADDIGDKRTNSVLSMSFNFRRKEDTGELVFTSPNGEDAFDRMRVLYGRLLKHLVARGVTPVNSAGNEGAVS